MNDLQFSMEAEERFPGFFVATLFKDEHVEVAQIVMDQTKAPRYPKEGWSCLKTSMMTTIMNGGAVYQEKGKEKRVCKPGDVVMISAGTEYYWELLTLILELKTANMPPYDETDRKVPT